MNTIKTLFILGSILGVVSFSSCSKDEEKAGCTNATAENFDPEATEDNGSCIISTKPLITIESPQLNEEPTEQNQLRVKILFEDQTELQSANINISSSITGGSAFVDQERNLDGNTDELDLLIDLPEFNLLGQHLLVVTAINVDGNEEIQDLDFKLVDNTNPVITINEVFAQSPNGAGTPYSKFDYSVSDNYELVSIRREFLKVDANGAQTGTYYDSTSEIILFEKDHSYFDDEITLSQGNSGSDYRARITATDAAGNEEVWLSDVRQL